jgi:hypothetical protein
MTITLNARARFALGVAAVALGAGTLVWPALLFLRAPAALAEAGAFATPLLIAGLALAGRGAYASIAGHRRRPKPPMRPGRMEPRPLSPMARRRPRT